MKSTPFLIALVTLTAACEAGFEDPDNQRRNTGAAGGAAVGAIVGAIAGDNNPAAVIAGAAAGGILGAGIGAALDQQAAELREDLGDGVTVTNTGSSLVVNFPENILFATDSASVPASRQADLRALAQNLQQYSDTTVQVIGHTDSTGTEAHNFDLSTRRAGSVASILVANGVSGTRITALGRGEGQPVASNATTAGRAENRRVEVVIRPTA